MEVDEEVTNGGAGPAAAVEAEPSKDPPGAGVKEEPGEEEDDPVIHEIPVYLSKGIQKLYLFQVPFYIHKWIVSEC